MARRAIGAAVALACALVPASAGAATFYASQGGGARTGCPSDDPCSLSAAIAQADQAVGRDTVQVVGALTTNAPVDLSGSPIDLVGTGSTAGGTAVEVTGAPALRLASGSSASQLRARSDQDVAVIDNGSLVRAVRIEGTGPAATGIVVGPGGLGDTTVDQSAISVPPGGAATGIAGSAAAASAVSVTDSTIAGGTGVALDGQVVLARDTVDATADGVRLESGSLSASSSVVVVHGAGSRGVAVAAQSTSPVTADLRQLTIDHPAPAGAGSRGVQSSATGLGGAGATLRGSVVRGFDADLESAGSNARLSVGTSDFHSTLGGPDTSPGGNLDRAPAYVRPSSGDYRLARTSPLVDQAGTATPAPPESATDRGGRPRVVDGDHDGQAERDIGAYERQPLTAALTVSPATVEVGRTVSFDAGGSSYPDGAIASYRWDLDGNGTFERRTGTAATTARSYGRARSYRATVRVTATDGSVHQVSRTVRVRADRTQPRFTRATMSNRTLSIAPEPTPYFARLAPRGTTFVFSVTEPGTLRAVIERRTKGRRVGRSCRLATRARRRRHLCVLYVSVGTLTRQVEGGTGTLPFTGRMGSRPLHFGFYRAVLRITDPAGNRSRGRYLGFRIVLR